MSYIGEHKILFVKYKILSLKAAKSLNITAEQNSTRRPYFTVLRLMNLCMWNDLVFSRIFVP